MSKQEEIEILLEGFDENNITSLLEKWNEINIIRRKVKEFEDMLRDKIKIYMKEREWERYSDKDSNISVSINKEKRQKVDMEQLKIMLTDTQLAQVVNITTYEKMLILTPESRKRLKKYVKKTKF